MAGIILIKEKKTRKEKIIELNSLFILFVINGCESSLFWPEESCVEIIEREIEMARSFIMGWFVSLNIEKIEKAYYLYTLLGEELEKYLQFLMRRTRSCPGIRKEKNEIVSLVNYVKWNSLSFKKNIEGIKGIARRYYGIELNLENKPEIWWTEKFQTEWDDLFFFSQNKKNEVIEFLNKEKERIMTLEDERNKMFLLESFVFWCKLQKKTLEMALENNEKQCSETGIVPSGCFCFFLGGGEERVSYDQQNEFINTFDLFVIGLSDNLRKLIKEIRERKIRREEEEYNQEMIRIREREQEIERQKQKLNFLPSFVIEIIFFCIWLFKN